MSSPRAWEKDWRQRSSIILERSRKSLSFALRRGNAGRIIQGVQYSATAAAAVVRDAGFNGLDYADLAREARVQAE